MLAVPSVLDLLFGRRGFIFFQNKPADDVPEGASAQKFLTALLFRPVTLLRCSLYLHQFESVGARRNFL